MAIYFLVLLFSFAFTFNSLDLFMGTFASSFFALAFILILGIFCLILCILWARNYKGNKVLLLFPYCDGMQFTGIVATICFGAAISSMDNVSGAAIVFRAMFMAGAFASFSWIIRIWIRYRKWKDWEVILFKGSLIMQGLLGMVLTLNFFYPQVAD